MIKKLLFLTLLVSQSASIQANSISIKSEEIHKLKTKASELEKQIDTLRERQKNQRDQTLIIEGAYKILCPEEFKSESFCKEYRATIYRFYAAQFDKDSQFPPLSDVEKELIQTKKDLLDHYPHLDKAAYNMMLASKISEFERLK